MVALNIIGSKIKSSLDIVWIASKILTVNKLIKRNNYEIYPILDIDSKNIKRFYNKNYETLLKHSNKNCEKYYKKCGILDTLGNIMCIPENEECPINEVKVDYYIKDKQYNSKEYKIVFLQQLKPGYALYYTNKEIDNKIVSKLDFFDTFPKYITEDNFIFDEKTYKKNFAGSNGGSTIDNDYLDDRKELYGDDKTTNHIKNSFNNINNFDKSFENVGNNLYIGNYIGFRDFNNMKTFMDINLYYLFLNPFPHYIYLIFCMAYLIINIGITFNSLKGCCRKDEPNEGAIRRQDRICILIYVILYLAFFIGIFIYSIYSFNIIYNKNNFGDINKVDADEFLEDLMNEVKGQHGKKIYHIAIIILFSSSITLFLVAWIITQIHPNIFGKYNINPVKKFPVNDKSVSIKINEGNNII